MSLSIRTFGHYWSRDLIDWGRRGPNQSGSLYGTSKLGSSKKLNFRNQVGIYVLFDRDRQVVYVGQTGSGNQRLFHRLRQHSRGHMRDRWTNFSWFGFLEIGADGELQEKTKNIDDDLASEVSGSHRDALDEVEAVLIQILEPGLNKQGPKWKSATEYFQYEPEVEAEPSLKILQDKLQEISKKLGIDE